MANVLALRTYLLLLIAYGIKVEGCCKTYDLIGCYEEKNPCQLLHNDRLNINWKNITSYMESLACKCSQLAKKAGFAGFAMHYYGECYGRSAHQLSRLTSQEHEEEKCVGDQSYTMCDKTKHEHCTGVALAEAVYKFKSSSEKDMNGGLGEWLQWTACDKGCGSGHRHRERICDNPLPKGNGKDCTKLGPLSQAQVCKIKECPIDGGWSAFGVYGPCSKKCDGGTKTKRRTCSNPTPAYGGKGCKGSSEKSVSCNIHKCPDIINCATKYTNYQTHSNGNLVYIDRHRMNCGGTGYIESMFHLQRSGGNMRYQYKCCSFKDKAVCNLAHKTTAFNDDGRGNAVYLDRHSADCGSNGFISDIRVERNSHHNKIRYNYYCCLLKSNWSGKTHCYTRSTSMTDDGNGKVYYLDRQAVSCKPGYGLSYFRLYRNSAGSHWAYRYRCCKVNH